MDTEFISRSGHNCIISGKVLEGDIGNALIEGKINT